MRLCFLNTLTILTGKDAMSKKKEYIQDYCLNCNTKLPRRQHSNKPRKFCGNNKCQHDFLRKSAIDKNIAGVTATKRYIIDTRGYQCEECNITEWRGKAISLELDHINGDFNNNSLDNVRLLCPNCHSQTHTYKIKNKGKGRLKNAKTPKPFYPCKSSLPC